MALSLLRASFGRLNSHRPEGDRISALLDGRDAVFPDPPGFALHHVERTRLRIYCETLPFVAGRAAKSKLAVSPQGQPEDPVEVRLVAVPSDADTDIVLRAQDLADALRRQIEHLAGDAAHQLAIQIRLHTKLRSNRSCDQEDSAAL